MKKKVRVKSLPKAQTGIQPPMVLTPEQKAIWIQNQGIWGNPPTISADVYTGMANTTGSFNVGMPEFVPTSVGEPLAFNNSINPFANPLSLYPRNTKLESGILSTQDVIRKSYTDQIPEDTRKLMGLEPYGDIKTKNLSNKKVILILALCC